MRVSLSLRGDYAVRVMLALGQHAHEHGASAPLLSASTIAARQRIPPRFIAHVLGDLVRAGLVVGATGRRGGYRLAADPAKIDLLRIVDAAEPRDTPPRCVLRGVPCDPAGQCAAHDAFSAATNAVRSELARSSLDSILERAVDA